jgi:hypothetical protein
MSKHSFAICIKNTDYEVSLELRKLYEIYHRQMKIRFLKISQVIDNQVIVKNIETENSIADGILPDAKSETLGMVRVVDESGDDYLYPQTFFIPLSLPAVVEEQVLLAA